tara:strand:- start:1681 stop:2043 length:363 start_codon:yes stop_codon:yes gene_type:complete
LIYPTSLTNYYHPDSIAADGTPVTILSGPFILKSFVCGNTKTINGSSKGGFEYKLFDGDDEIFRVRENGGDLTYGAVFPRYSFSFPLNGIRISNSLQASMSTVGTYINATAVGISILYQR